MQSALWELKILLKQDFFVTGNEEKITADLEKLVTFGRCIYTGKIDNYNATRVYCNKHGFVAILEVKEDKVITCYKVDLGLGEELNDSYVEKVLDKIDKLETDICATVESNEQELAKVNEEKELIQQRIKEYNNLIKDLEKRTQDLTDYGSSLITKRTVLEQELKDTVAKLTAKIKI